MEVEELKDAQKEMWAGGEYAAIAKLLEPASFDLIERIEIEKKMDLLDVACGTGNSAIPAAKAGAKVTGVDLTPALLSVAKRRAASSKVKIEWIEADAEDLPFEDDSFDRVTSVFGVMFAPRHRRAASELIRVLRPGGMIGVASWTPEGVMGQVFKISSAYMPRPPDYASSPDLWGNEKHVRELFAGSRLAVSFERRSVEIPADSPEDLLKLLEDKAGPLVAAKAALEAQQWKEMRAELLDLFTSSNKADDESLRHEWEYLVVLARSTTD